MKNKEEEKEEKMLSQKKATEKDVIILLKNFFTNDYEIDQWLNTPNPNFGLSSPQHLINNGKADKVFFWIEANLEGY